jgi:hypothetical protein
MRKRLGQLVGLAFNQFYLSTIRSVYIEPLQGSAGILSLSTGRTRWQFTLKPFRLVGNRVTPLKKMPGLKGFNYIPVSATHR